MAVFQPLKRGAHRSSLGCPAGLKECETEECHGPKSGASGRRIGPMSIAAMVWRNDQSLLLGINTSIPVYHSLVI